MPQSVRPRVCGGQIALWIFRQTWTRTARYYADIQPDEVPKDPVEEAELEDLLAEMAKEGPEKEPETWGFVVSVTRGGHHRKLHHVGECRLVPGIHCREYQFWGAVLPGERGLIFGFVLKSRVVLSIFWASIC